MIIEGQAFFQSYDLAPHPPLPPLLSVSSTGDILEWKTKKERQVAEGRGKTGMSEEPKQRTAEKTWPSINCSILSDTVCSFQKLDDDIFIKERKKEYLFIFFALQHCYILIYM
jgi:hypothetical protein